MSVGQGERKSESDRTLRLSAPSVILALDIGAKGERTDVCFCMMLVLTRI